MLSFFVGLLTVVLVLDCLFLLLLILIQLPKKEAGLGQAFGSSTTDALFGAGSGNALTKMTKYATVVFLLLTFVLAIMNAQQSSEKRNAGKLRRSMELQSKKTTASPVSIPAASSNAPIKVEMTNMPSSALPAVTSSNKPVAPAPVPAASNAASAAQPK